MKVLGRYQLPVIIGDVRNSTTNLRYCCVSHVKVAKKVNPKRSPLKDFFSISLIVYLYEMMDVY